MKKAIVTGANGFIGSAIVKELINNNYEVLALCHNENCSNLPNNQYLKVYNFDLHNLEKIKDTIKIDEYLCAYHFAWEGSAGKARADTELQLNNTKWTIEFMRIAKDLGCKRFVCAGSIMEHETIAAAYTQGNKPGLGYIYGSAKLVAHTMCMSVAADIGIDLIWPEITNAYGVGERSPRMVNTTIKKCINNVSPEFTTGTQNYDFIYIDDVARAFRLIAENGKPFYEYLVGSSYARPLKEFLLEMKSSIAPDLEFKFGDIPFTGVDMPISRFDCSETEKDTGFKAEITFAEGCKKTAEWWKKIMEDENDTKI